MDKHIDIIAEMIEFANQNWVQFKNMTEERGHEGNIEEQIQSLENDLYK